MKAIPLTRWPDYLLDWADPDKGPLAQSPARRELQIVGELPDANGSLVPFPIGRSRDEFGSVILLSPQQNHPLVDKDAKNKSRNLRAWNQWWAKIAVRAGYLSPSIDPGGLAILDRLRRRDSRVDFIVDTNVLISGVGHWLVRGFGDVCDLVRTVVTDLEVQRFGDALKWTPTTFDGLADRTAYLTASRFLEYLEEQHPVWRRLDIEEETALFVASASKEGKKSPGADTLLLRAVRRSLQDQVPGLARLFVTGDQNLARAASHDLPLGSTIAAYVNPLPEQGSYLSSVRWWPVQGADTAQGYMSSLADFCYEATCLCDAVRILKPDGSYIRISSYLPGRNQFPTHWSGPRVWLEESAVAQTPPVSTVAPLETAPASEISSPKEDTVRAEGLPKQEGDAIVIGSTNQENGDGATWPFASSAPVLIEVVECAARVSAPVLLDVLSEIITASRESRTISERVFVGSADTARELRSFLRAVDALSETVQPGPAAPSFQDAFARNDTDALSKLLTRASEFHVLIEQLSSRKSSRLDKLDVPKRSATALSTLARLLGQAVYINDELVYGGAYIARDDFITWISETVEVECKGPLGQALLADISRKALFELSMSPARLEKAIEAATQGAGLAAYEFVAGGTPEHVLEEEVVVLNARGWSRREVSADGLMGYRSVRRR